MKIEKFSSTSRDYIKDKETKTIVFELKEDDDITLFDGTRVSLPMIHFENNKAKTYIVLKSVKPLKDKESIVTLDFVYGNLNFSILNSNEEYRNKFLKYVFSREAIDGVIKKRFGLLPDDVRIPQNIDENFIPSEKDYIFDDDIGKIVSEGVIKASHREVIIDEQEDVDIPEPENDNSKSADIWENFKITLGRDVHKKRKENPVTFRDILDQMKAEKTEKANARREERKRKEDRRAGRPIYETTVAVKEADLSEIDENKLMIFYNSGLLIKESAKYDNDGIFRGEIKTELLERYNLYLIDKNMNKSVRSNTISNRDKNSGISFLMSGIEETELTFNEAYRKKFVDDICIPIIKYAENGSPEALEYVYPYLGHFNAESNLAIDYTTSIYKYYRDLGKDQNKSR